MLNRFCSLRGPLYHQQAQPLCRTVVALQSGLTVPVYCLSQTTRHTFARLQHGPKCVLPLDLALFCQLPHCNGSSFHAFPSEIRQIADWRRTRAARCGLEPLHSFTSVHCLTCPFPKQTCQRILSLNMPSLCRISVPSCCCRSILIDAFTSLRHPPQAILGRRET